LVRFRSPFRTAITVVVLCILELPALSLAQQIDVNGMPYDTEEQLMDCPPRAVLPPAVSAKLISCQKAEAVEVSLPLKPDANGNAKEKRVRGAYEFREYRTKNEQDFTFHSLLDALPTVGFVVKYSYKPATITARNGDLWILVNVSDDSYNITTVREPSEEWPMVKTAEEISREVKAHNRVDIYGIEFSPDDQSIAVNESQILFEILKYLKQNNDLSVIVESDKITPNYPPEVDWEITRERANAVMDWLIAHGVARSRVQPRPAGRNNPITENEGPSEIQRNERIVLIRAVT
jgi:outer membrane protein OmpA-like peptidoglycan-associated protein